MTCNYGLLVFRSDANTLPIFDRDNYPGGKALASTTSSASLIMLPSSFGPKSGDRGRAINPVRADSKMPKGETSFMNESILVGFADLRIISNVIEW